MVLERHSAYPERSRRVRCPRLNRYTHRKEDRNFTPVGSEPLRGRKGQGRETQKYYYLLLYY
ncbi:hypothetical protein BDQ94DRAFT_148698, partial [Aspergillus welwitschiae]